MQLMVSRSYPVIDAQTLGEYATRDALFRAADGSYFLYMASEGHIEGEERILFLDCRDALLWLNETLDALGSYWHFAERENQRYRLQNIASNAFFQCTERRDRMMIDVSQTGERLLIEGSLEGLDLKELFLLLSSTGLAYRRCRLVRVAGDQIGVEFLARDTLTKKKALKKRSPDRPFESDSWRASMSDNGMVRPCSRPSNKRCLCGAPKTRSPPWQKPSRVQSPSSASISARTHFMSSVSINWAPSCCGRSGRGARWRHGSRICRLV